MAGWLAIHLLVSAGIKQQVNVRTRLANSLVRKDCSHAVSKDGRLSGGGLERRRDAGLWLIPKFTDSK